MPEMITFAIGRNLNLRNLRFFMKAVIFGKIIDRIAVKMK